MKKRVYYLIRLWQQAPLRISAGFGEATDSDLIRDSRGLPYIPGSSLAGALRSMLPQAEGDELFGFFNGDQIVESRMAVSDAALKGTERDCFITIRDGVALTDEGIAADGRKYDFEVLETSKPYEAVLEVNDTDAGGLQALAEKMLALASRGFSLGARTTRGYGRMRMDVRRRTFILPDDLNAWLDWDPRGEGAWEAADRFALPEQAETPDVEICASLVFDGSFAVRVYDDPDDHGADYTYMRPADGGKRKRAVIPGTTWAGVFRHHMRRLCGEAGLKADVLRSVDSFFGVPENDSADDIHRSLIRFDETVVSGGDGMGQVRVAVDRFTAKPRDGALYHTEAYRGGNGQLRITFPRKAADRMLLSLLEASLKDLNYGVMSFGGETGTGRGMARISAITVNGADRTAALKNGALLSEEVIA